MEINVVALLVTTVVVGLVAYSWWRNRQATVLPTGTVETLIASVAARHGGQSASSGDRRKPVSSTGSTGGTTWRMDYFTKSKMSESYVTGFNELSPYFLWKASAPTPTGSQVVVIQSVPGQIENFHRATNTPLVGGLSLKNALWFASNLTDIQLPLNLPLIAGGDTWGERFAIFASDEAAARLVNTQVKALLSAYAADHADNSAPLLVTLTTAGLSLLVQPQRSDMVTEAFIEEVIQLGSGLVQSVEG